MTALNLTVLVHGDPLLADPVGIFAQAASAVDSLKSTVESFLSRVEPCAHCRRPGDPSAKRRIAELCDDVERICRGAAHSHHSKLSAAPTNEILQAQARHLIEWQQQIAAVRQLHGGR